MYIQIISGCCKDLTIPYIIGNNSFLFQAFLFGDSAIIKTFIVFDILNVIILVHIRLF